MKLIIQVTQEDIDNGIPGNDCGCPIARSIKRNPDIDPETVMVGEDELWLSVPSMRCEFELDMPDIATRFIAEFDAGKVVYPFTFEIEIPDFSEDE